MSTEFWAGYASGAAGIIIGNPLDLIKTRVQAGSLHDGHVTPALTGASTASTSTSGSASTSTLLANGTTLQPGTSPSRLSTLVRGAAAPILGYGALNALLFTTYNHMEILLDNAPAGPRNEYSSSLAKTFVAGAVAGLATFVVSAPTELVKCRVQVSSGNVGSWQMCKQIWRGEGGGGSEAVGRGGRRGFGLEEVRGFYFGGGVTALRDSIGYGFYYWSYVLSKRTLGTSGAEKPEWMTVLLCGGIAGVVTWASIFPLDVIKTRMQTQGLTRARSPASEGAALLSSQVKRLNATEIAREAYRSEGIAVFFRGLGVCSARAFVVNAVQWAVYEWIVHMLLQRQGTPNTIDE